MNVIDKICEKYTTEFNLMFDIGVRPLDLRFGASVPATMQAQLEAGLFRMSIFRGMGGVTVQLDMDENGVCIMSVGGAERYRFAPRAAGLAFPNYDMTECILWVLYILATGKNWLDNCRGMYLSCRCFSARQQATAARIQKSVARQYDTAVSVDETDAFYEKWEKYLKEAARRAPRFSARPIPTATFAALKGKSKTVHLGEMARTLYGTEPFAEEIDRYLEGLKTGASYRNWLEEATKDLADIAYRLPIMATNNLFTAVGTYIDNIRTESPDRIESGLNRQESFALTPASLQECFGGVEAAYCRYAEDLLRADFFRTVRDRVRSFIHTELLQAQQNIYYLNSDLHSFCFTDAESFGQGDVQLLSWKQLADLRDSDVYSDDVAWTTGALHSLQSRLKSIYAPQLWICSDPLKNMSDDAMIADAELTRSVPVTDEKLVWAIWADVRI